MKTENFVVENTKVSNDHTLALISDMHLKDTIDTFYFNSLIETIDNINPSYITLAGDYFHGLLGKYTFWNEQSRRHLLYYLHAFREIAPVIMSLGNHDIERLHDKEKRKHFKSLESKDLYPLDNENIVLNDMNFMGYIPPKWAYPVDRIVRRKEKMIVKDIKTVNFETKEDKMNILLSHLPNILRDKYIMERCPELYKYDLVLSGHHHGGLTEKQEVSLNKRIDRLEQINILKKHKNYLEELRYAGYMWITLNAIPFISKTTRGMHNVGGSTMIISRGAKTTHGIDDAYVTKVDIIKTK